MTKRLKPMQKLWNKFWRTADREAMRYNETCLCGHSGEEHGHDPKYRASTACTQCKCFAFEPDCGDE